MLYIVVVRKGDEEERELAFRENRERIPFPFRVTKLNSNRVGCVFAS